MGYTFESYTHKEPYVRLDCIFIDFMNHYKKEKMYEIKLERTIEREKCDDIIVQ